MSPKTPQQWTILLLSSEPVLRSVIREALEGAGYVVLSTGDLGSAVDRLKEFGADLLVTHPYIDTMSGHDAAKYLQGRRPKMRILMMAGLIEDDRLRLRAEVEHFEIFPRPISRRELLDKVREVLSAPETQQARA
jgi:DNA-binding response OmpR family regulator